MSQFFASGDQSIGASASGLPILQPLSHTAPEQRAASLNDRLKHP